MGMTFFFYSMSTDQCEMVFFSWEILNLLLGSNRLIYSGRLDSLSLTAGDKLQGGVHLSQYEGKREKKRREKEEKNLLEFSA